MWSQLLRGKNTDGDLHKGQRRPHYLSGLRGEEHKRARDQSLDQVSPQEVWREEEGERRVIYKIIDLSSRLIVLRA